MKRTTLTIVTAVVTAVLTIAYAAFVPRRSVTDGADGTAQTGERTETAAATAQSASGNPQSADGEQTNPPMREITGEKYVIPATFGELPFQLQLLSEKKDGSFAFPLFGDKENTANNDKENNVKSASETTFIKAINICAALYFSPTDFFDDEKTYTKDGDWTVTDYTYSGFEDALTQVFTREWVENALADEVVALKEINGKLAYRDKKVKRASISKIEFTAVNRVAGEYKFSGVFRFDSVSNMLTADFETENGGHYAKFRWF